MPFQICSICHKPGAFKCEHDYCTHTSYGDVLLPPALCSDCTQQYQDSEYVLVNNSQGSDPLSTAITKEGLGLKQQSCWRCQLLQKECDGELPCGECTLQDEGKWYLACQRDKIHDRIRGAIPDINLGAGNWALQGAGRINYRISVAFDPTAYKYIFKDFKESDAGRDTCLTQPPIPIDDFLRQFHNMNWQWTNCFEQDTVEIIRHCAQYQATLLSRVGIAPSSLDPNDNILLIALALRCMALTHEIFRLDANVPHLYFDRGETSYECSTYDESDPYIDIWTTTTDWSKTSGLPTSENLKPRDNLPRMLEQILEKTQRILFRRDPRDWPMLLCTLCLFTLIRQNFNPSGRWMRSLKKAGLAMDHVHTVLCQLYEMVTDGEHPLSDNWAQEEYAKQTEDEASVTCMQELHRMWQEGAYH